MDSPRDAFLAEVRETYGRLVYTHKTQEKQAEWHTATGRRFRIWNVVVLAVTLGAALTAPLLDSKAAAWVGAVGALVAFVFAAVQLSFDPQKAAADHRLAAKTLLALRDDYARLIADAKSGVGLDRLRARRDELATRASLLHTLVPQTDNAAYQLARSALAGTEELTFTPIELDRMLPTALRERPTPAPGTNHPSP